LAAGRDGRLSGKTFQVGGPGPVIML
jgi:hypothetical protein